MQFLNKRLPRLRVHVDLVQSIRDRDRNRLTDWERRFLTSIVRFDSVSQKQVETLKTIIAKTIVKGSPKRTPRPKRGAPQ